MEFHIIRGFSELPPQGTNKAYLQIDNWNDYLFTTMFSLTVDDEIGVRHLIGRVKIGFKGQVRNVHTADKVADIFSSLSDVFFSIGEDETYYQELYRLPHKSKELILHGLNDLVGYSSSHSIPDWIKKEEVFKVSLLRYSGISAITGQYLRVLNGGAVQTAYDFTFFTKTIKSTVRQKISFKVNEPDTFKISTNIHALIGTNGVGKTTLLNSMISSILNNPLVSESGFYTENFLRELEPMESHYFNGVISVAFSVFDPFNPPSERLDPTLGATYEYIGLKKPGSSNTTFSFEGLEDLREELLSSLVACFNQDQKKLRWHTAIESLSSDHNFSNMCLSRLMGLDLKLNDNGDAVEDSEDKGIALRSISDMSSGHFIILYTITKLVEKLQEKTLVLIDEPESHLHPPLLSAFMRALGELLSDRNGVAIIATHSPVVLQEIPRSCVWKMNRSGMHMSFDRPSIETFGENVGVLTREVFGLEVTKSGFHKLLQESVDQGHSFNTIMNDYQHSLGFEAQTILRAMIFHRDNK